MNINNMKRLEEKVTAFSVFSLFVHNEFPSSTPFQVKCDQVDPVVSVHTYSSAYVIIS